MTAHPDTPSTNSLLMIIICLLLPPLGAAMARGIGTQFIINIVLTILGYFPGQIHALWLTFNPD